MKIQFDYPEGATPIQDYSCLKLAWIQTQKDLNRAEAENIAAAQKKYLSKPVHSPVKWFEPTSLKKIHKDMYGNVWDWAGEYRKEITSIGIKPFMIPSQLAELCSEVKYWLTDPVELTFLEQAARIHHKLVFIHPFENGNGRFSRLIADRYLMFWGCQHPQWPVELQKNGSSRSEYIKSLKCADQGDYNPLITFIQNLGIKNPPLSELLGLATYKDKLTNSQRLAIVKASLRIGCQVNETENNGYHPLHIAIKKGYDEVALILLQHEADITFRDRSGYDPFELTISMANLKLAHAICKAGYPYDPNQPQSIKLLQHQATLHEFKMQFR